MPLIDELNSMRDYFRSRKTYPVSFRKKQLRRFKEQVIRFESQIYDALYADLGKSKEECWATENGFLIAEINHALKHLDEWANDQQVSTNLLNFPSSSYVMQEPLGVVLIIAPWNYPFQLMLTPLVAALAAGNCAVIKPSELAPATENVIQKIILESFDENYVKMVKGEGGKIVPELINGFHFDHIFYTGSTQVGKLIYKMAAEKLVPVTLELGGKSPALLEEDANLEVAARRIAMSKFSNAGQMCVAPDYLLVPHALESELINCFKKTIIDFFGDDASSSYDYGKIINEKHFERLVNYLKDGEIVVGGRHDKSKLFIEPTLMRNIRDGAAVMEDEIFGPILPIIPYKTREEALTIIEKNKNPLAFYIFSSSKKNQQYWLNQVQSGGVCINSAAIHLTNPSLPFGGIGNSGIGQYHGKFGFDTFTHPKAVLKVPAWLDPSIKYPSYKGKLSLFKKIIR